MEMHLPAAVLEARQFPAPQPIDSGLEFSFSPQLRVNFDKQTRAMWSRWAPEPRACFNPALLSSIRSYYDFLAASSGQISCCGEDYPIEYVVLASDSPGVFNLGGDLDLFRQLIHGPPGISQLFAQSLDLLLQSF